MNEIMSPTIKNLAIALSKVQAEIKGSKLDAENPFFHSEYSTLTSVWDACRKLLTDNGLAVVQTMEPVIDLCSVTTTLLHVSGEWIRGTIQMKPVKNDPQAVGSCITYARRYSLAAIVGISPADDDGNASSGRDMMDQRLPSERHQTANGAPKRPDNPRPPTTRPAVGSSQGAAPAKEQPPLPWEDNPPTTGAVNQELKKPRISKIGKPKFDTMVALLKQQKISPVLWKNYLKAFGYSRIDDITEEKYQEIFDTITKTPEKITGEKK